MMFGILDKLGIRQERQFQLMRGFNKAALVGNAAATGYAVNGYSGAVVSTALLLFSHKFADKELPGAVNDEALSVQPGFRGFLDTEKTFGAEIKKLKNEMGVEGEVRVVIQDGLPSAFVIQGDGDKDKDAADYYLYLPTGYFQTMDEDEVLSIAGHEFGHIVLGDVDTRHKVKHGSKWSNAHNGLFGVVNSIVNLNPWPAIAGALGAGLNQALRIKGHQLFEHSSDILAAKHTDGKTFARVFGREIVNPNHAVARALENRDFVDRSSRLSIFLRRHGLEQSFDQAKTLFDKMFKDGHPSPQNRLNRIEAFVQETDPDYERDSVPEHIEMTLCSSCVDARDEFQQNRLRAYANTQFVNYIGHSNVDINFEDRCGNRPSLFDIFASQMGGGMVIVVSTDFDGEPPTAER